MNLRKRAAIGLSVGALALGAASINNVQAAPDKGDKITICHATASHTNPWVIETVDEESLDVGHGHSGVNANDIIPPEPDVTANNWTVANQDIFEDGCKVVDDDSTPPPSDSPSPSPSGSPSATPKVGLVAPVTVTQPPTPNTGADVPYLPAGGLVLAGLGSIIAAARRRFN